MLTEGFFEGGKGTLETWTLDLAPALIAVHSLRTGEQFQEPSLAAAQVERAASRLVIGKYLAAGEAARGYENTLDAAVFSPLREGQVACYDGAVFLFRTLLRRVGPFLPKPVVCARVQEHTTQVEEIALTDAFVQAGARKVLLYRGPLSGALEAAAGQKELRHAVVVHIEPSGIPGGFL